MHQSHLIYLHGLASGPSSYKARLLCEHFKEIGKELIIPDFNQNDFTNLTLSRQLKQLETIVSTLPGPVSIIGSSLGGITAAIFAEQHLQISKLVLLAPAFNFLEHWLPTFSATDLKQWQLKGYHSLYHYSYHRRLPLAYDFIKDLKSYGNHSFKREIPTLIIHGSEDETIPLSASQQYAHEKDWVKLITVQSDHSLASVLPQICEQLSQFL